MGGKASSAVCRDKAAVPVVIGLGGNRWHGRHGRPEAVLRAAAEALADAGLEAVRLSRIRTTAPLGPRQRRFANAAALGVWRGEPLALLVRLKAIERAFGRRRNRRWGPRVLDLDLLAFAEEVVRAPGLAVPHPGLSLRPFALQPLAELWPGWRHPVLNLPARALLMRLMKRRAIDPLPPGS